VALAQDHPLPTPEEIGIEAPAYLNGLAEAASAMRRRSLDLIRHGQNAAAERCCWRWTIYAVLMTFGFPKPSPAVCAIAWMRLGAGHPG
jgi:translin